MALYAGPSKGNRRGDHPTAREAMERTWRKNPASRVRCTPMRTAIVRMPNDWSAAASEAVLGAESAPRNRAILAMYHQGAVSIGPVSDHPAGGQRTPKPTM